MNKFKFEDNRPLKDKVIYFLRGLVFWKGRRALSGPVRTRDLEWNDFRYIFFPKGFEEKYGYLGTSVWGSGYYFKHLYPLVLALDYEARPKWCPRWFLRFLHVFGDDRSIVRVRYRSLSNLKRRLTKGIAFVDWKTKWTDYDLRISISAPQHLQDLADAIETYVYNKGYKEEITNEILKLDPTANVKFKSTSELKKMLEELDPSEVMD
jgi:hypothetical protein